MTVHSGDREGMLCRLSVPCPLFIFYQMCHNLVLCLQVSIIVAAAVLVSATTRAHRIAREYASVASVALPVSTPSVVHR